jgi:hypothetical protein
MKLVLSLDCVRSIVDVVFPHSMHSGLSSSEVWPL